MSLERIQESNVLDNFKEPLKQLKSSIIKDGHNNFYKHEEIPVSLRVEKSTTNYPKKEIKTEISWYSNEEHAGKAPGSNRERRNYLNLYLNTNRKLSNENYNEMFKWLNEVKQWKIWNCYFITAIKNIARSDFFDILMKTSIESRWNWDYYIYMPLWEPRWKKITITPQDLEATTINWAIWYKILEAGFAKYLLFKKNIIPNTDITLTHKLIKKTARWKSWNAMQTILWPKSFNTKTVICNKEKYHIIFDALKNFNPKNLSTISISSRQSKWKTDKDSYEINWEKMYYNHSYSLYSVEKKWDRIVSVVLENPRNNEKKEWWWKVKLPILLFLAAIHSITIGKTTHSFLNHITTTDETDIVDPFIRN